MVGFDHNTLLSFLVAKLKHLCRFQVDHFGLIIRLIDSDEFVGEIEHVVSEGDYDELGIFRALFDVVCND